MKALIITGKYMYALPMLVFGIMHIMNADAMAAMVPSYFYIGVFWVYLTGLGFIGSAVSILVNVYTRLACYLLAFMLLVFVFTMHLPGVLSGGEGAQMAMGGLLKDFALAAAAIIIGSISEGKE
jgi:putative oxidoreductase